jgi:hypothetical protein
VAVLTAETIYKGVVTIDQRLDRLVQRHEALTESVQALLDSQREHEERSEKQFAQHEQLFGQIALRLCEVTNGIDRLARVAGVHQERLDDHQQKLDDLERGPRS